MSLLTNISDVYNESFPRVSGDEPYPRAPSTAHTRFSPRERG